MTDPKSSSTALTPYRSIAGRIPLLLLVVTVVGAVVGWQLYLHYRDRVSTDDAQIDGHLVPVAAKVSSNIEKVLVNDNQQVHRGDLLVQLDARDLEARVRQASATVALAIATHHQALAMQNQANAALDLARAALREAQSAPEHAKAQHEGAQADVDKAVLSLEQASGAELQVAEATLESRKATLTNARTELERMRPLAKRQEISQLQFDTLSTAVDVAESETKAAQRRVDSLRQEAKIRQAFVGVQGAKVTEAKVDLERATATVARAEADVGRATAGVEQAHAGVEQAEAGVEQAQANLQALLLQLSYTRIEAPIDGVVTAKTAEPGQIIQPGQGLLVLVPLTQTWVTANFKETQLQDVRPGMPAEIYVDLSGNTLRGHVDSIAGATGARLSLLPPENAVGNFVKVVQRVPVKIVFDASPTEVLRPGMSVDATILTDKPAGPSSK